MKAVLLAAGVGSRITKDILHNHKCMLPIDKKDDGKLPLITYTVQTLLAHNIQDITVVTGYRHEELEHGLKCFDTVTCIFNPFYYLVNSIGSLWFARKQIISSDEDIIIMNADTFMEEKIFDMCINGINNLQRSVLLIDSSRKDKADVKVTYHNSLLELYNKQIALPPMAESVDVVRIPKNFVPRFYIQLQEMLEKKHHDIWWESVLVEYKDQYPIQVMDVVGNFWSEIDYVEDYHRICDFMSNYLPV